MKADTTSPLGPSVGGLPAASSTTFVVPPMPAGTGPSFVEPPVAEAESAGADVDIEILSDGDSEVSDKDMVATMTPEEKAELRAKIKAKSATRRGAMNAFSGAPGGVKRPGRTLKGGPAVKEAGTEVGEKSGAA